MKLINRLRIFLLALALVPLLSFTTAPGAVSAHPTTRYLKLVSLKCIETEDWASDDEPYLKIYDPNTATYKAKIWTDSLNNGQSDDLTDKPVIEFEGSLVHVALYDHDSPDADDWLGTNFAYAAQVGTGNHTVSFTEDGAYYQLTYYVY